MISIHIVAMPTAFEKLQSGMPQIIERLKRKMTLLMLQLQSRIVGESIPAFFPNGAPNIAGSVRAIPAELEGTIIHGEVQAGGPRTTKVTLKSGAQVDYAAVQHEGIAHSYEIRPFNKKALAFLLDGKQVITKLVHHTGLQPRPYMTSELQNMESQIVEELQQEFMAALQ